MERPISHRKARSPFLTTTNSCLPVVVRVDQARPLISPGYDRDTDEASVRARWARYYLGDEEAV